MEEKDKLLDIFYEIKEIVKNIYDEDRIDTENHTQLYMIAQEACYGLNISELVSLKYTCEDLLEDRRD